MLKYNTQNGISGVIEPKYAFVARRNKKRTAELLLPLF